jgi:hypothetical protein
MLQPAKLKFISIYFLAVVIPFLSRGQDPQVSARTDATKILVGDQIKLFLEASHHQDTRIVWAAIPDSIPSLEILEQGKIDTIRNGETLTYKQRLLITGFDSGLFLIPAFAFSVNPATGDPYILLTDSFMVEVQTIPVDTTKPFRGIKAIMEAPSSWKDYLWLILFSGIGLCLLGLLVYYVVKKRRTPKSDLLPPVPPESAHEKALRLLAELEDMGLWQKDMVKEYYVQLSDIVRSYLEERFQTPALELTTGELLKKAKKHPELNRQLVSLSFILQTSDLAKFAKVLPLPHEHTQSMDYAKDLVRNTRPVTSEINQQQI